MSRTLSSGGRNSRALPPRERCLLYPLLIYSRTYLYILGGIDTMGNALSNVLVFNIQTHELNSIDNMLSPHSYHSVEFLENYDCIIVLGGENTKECEIYDLFIKKWTMLPELNYPRANVCVYFEQKNDKFWILRFKTKKQRHRTLFFYKLF